jgi:hypothetical protein
MAACCNFCDWETGEPERSVAGCLATWHVYEKHPDIWRQVAGDRPPLDPDPRIPAVRAQISGN